MNIEQLFAATIAAGAVILREGLEAALILAAIAGTLRKINAEPKAIRLLWGGAIAALFVSIAAVGGAISLAIQIPERYQEQFEGVVGLVAVVVLFFVINWLFHNSYVDRWKAFVEGGTKRALATGTLRGLAVLGFIVVLREGLETALFIQAIILSQGIPGTVTGIVVGAAITALAIWGILAGSLRLPVGMVFKWTTVILIVLALSITGGSIHEFQEVGWLTETRLAFMPDATWVRKTFGIYPYLETLLAQLVLAVAFTVSWVVVSRRKQPKPV